MNGMKGAFLILALIAGVALAVPANPAPKKDAAEPAKPESAAEIPPPEIPAKVEEAAKSQPAKPAGNATARAAAEGSKKPSGDAAAPASAPAEEKIEQLSFDLPIGSGGKSGEAIATPSEFPNIEQIVGAPKPASSIEQLQGDAPIPSSFEVIQDAQPIAELPIAPAAPGIVDAKDAGFGAPIAEQFPQPPSAEQEREKMIDEMIEKLLKLKSMGSQGSSEKIGSN